MKERIHGPYPWTPALEKRLKDFKIVDVGYKEGVYVESNVEIHIYPALKKKFYIWDKFIGYRYLYAMIFDNDNKTIYNMGRQVSIIFKVDQKGKIGVYPDKAIVIAYDNAIEAYNGERLIIRDQTSDPFMLDDELQTHSEKATKRIMGL